MSISQYSESEASISDSLDETPIIPINPTTTAPPNPYLTLITQEFQTPAMLAITDLYTRACWTLTLLCQQLPSLFDIDTAVGDQLDIIGEWIGFNRVISPGITNASFSWGVDGLGWGQAYWETYGSGGSITILPDPIYRQILYTKRILNSWDGSIPEIVNALQTAFKDNEIIVIDGQDMTMTIDIAGYVNPLTVALIQGGYFNLKPAGVHITFNASSIFFGWGIETAYIKGWSEGNWATVVYSF